MLRRILQGETAGRIDSNTRDLGLQQDNSDNLQRNVIFIFGLIQLFYEKVFIPTQGLLLAVSTYRHIPNVTVCYSLKAVIEGVGQSLKLSVCATQRPTVFLYAQLSIFKLDF